MFIPRIDILSFHGLADSLRRPFHANYLAMYSSVYGGITTDPALMMVPADDHLVHRGDGVFETFKCVNGSIYNMDAHLERLEASARALSFDVDRIMEGIRAKTVETVKAGGKQECLIKVIISRGPGSMGVNPYDCPRNELYVMVSLLGRPFMFSHPSGAKLMTSKIPAKLPFFATIKHCNYLPNVLMQKEAVDAGVDFVATFDAEGRLAEGATENIGMVLGKALVFPRLGGVLAGTTMVRVMTLAESLVKTDSLKRVGFGDITRAGLLEADEIIITGTTRDVTSVVEFDRKPVGKGVPGPVGKRLNELLLEDIRSNRELLTAVF